MSLIKWVYDQTDRTALIKTTLVLGITGFIPYAWYIGLPPLLAYGIFKAFQNRRTLSRSLYQIEDTIVEYWTNLSQRASDRLASLLQSDPIYLLKAAFTFLLLLNLGISSWSIIAIYGIYRISNQEWITTFVDRAERMYDFFSNFTVRLRNDLNFRKKLIAGGVGTTLIAAEVYIAGWAYCLGIALSIVQMIAISIGLSTILKDIRHIFKTPIYSFIHHPGKILVALLGRLFSYKVFAGSVKGTMGPTVGHLENSGIFSGLFSALLNPNGGGFALNTGLTGLFFSRLGTFFNAMLTSLFITQEVHVLGDFYGNIGPTALQMFFCMICGSLIGYAVERFVDALYAEAENDLTAISEYTKNKAASVQNKVNNTAQAVHPYRYHAGFIVGATPVIAIITGAPAYLGVGMLAANVVIATAMVASMLVLYVTIDSIRRAIAAGKRVINRRRQQMVVDNPVPDVPEVVVPAELAHNPEDVVIDLGDEPPPPVFAPGFAAAQQQPVALEQPVIQEEVYRPSDWVGID